MKTTMKAILASLFACAAFVTTSDARSNTPDSNGHGFASVYGNVPQDQVEFLTTPDQIKAVVNGSTGQPSLIWETLEHAERVECLDCIPMVEPLLYDANAKTREIAAWWLRRRMFGVFGQGEVYERVIGTLASDPNAQKRAYAASALGEFFVAPGIDACAAALKTDPDPGVRSAAALALGRLNDDGAGALSVGVGDANPKVKLASMAAAAKINVFTDSAAVAKALGDGDATVRRGAVQLLDAMRAKDTVAAVLALAQKDPDENVRIAACHALGVFGDPSAQNALQGIANGDKSSLVQDMAKIALRML